MGENMLSEVTDLGNSALSWCDWSTLLNMCHTSKPAKTKAKWLNLWMSRPTCYVMDILHIGFIAYSLLLSLGLSTGTRASGYPGSKISARVGTVGPPVLINTSRLAKISAAMKSCTPRVVVALRSATEASHLSGRQGADEVGRAEWVCGLAAWVTLPPAVLLQRQDAIAIVWRTCLYPHLQRRWLLNLAWHRWLLNISQSQLGCLLLPG